MKRFNFHPAYLILGLLVLLLVGGIAMAAGLFEKDVPSSGTIINNDPAMTFYTDSTLTTELTSITWGDVLQGETSAVDVWVKNTGNNDFTVVSVSHDLDTSYGTIDISTNNFALATGGSQQVTLTLTPDIGGSYGTISPTIHFASTY